MRLSEFHQLMTEQSEKESAGRLEFLTNLESNLNTLLNLFKESGVFDVHEPLFTPDELKVLRTYIIHYIKSTGTYDAFYDGYTVRFKKCG